MSYRRQGTWRIWRTSIATAAIVGAGFGASFMTALPAEAVARQHAVSDWVAHHATPLNTFDPAAPPDDLAPLRSSIGDAEIVGLGESVHGASEEEALKHRTLRFLVERMGFRSIAWEEQWTVGIEVNDYIRTGKGDLDVLMSQMSGQWQTRETESVLRWLRDYNQGRDDKVSFFGVEYYFTGSPAYDAIEDYVTGLAPDRLDELHHHLRPIRPSVPNIYQHIAWYQGVPDQEPYIRHARQVYRLLQRLPHTPGDRDHALVLHHARQIVSFYEHYHLSDADALVYRDAQTAKNLRWWRDFTGDKIAFWAASPHTANAPRLRIVMPGGDDMQFPSAGSYLRRWYGHRYLSIGYTFDHGTVSLGPEETIVMTPSDEEWFEQPFGTVSFEQFAIDLRQPSPPPVQRWLHAPLTTRGLPQAGPEAFIDGGTLSRWFDVIVHRQRVSPTQAVSSGSPG